METPRRYRVDYLGCGFVPDLDHDLAVDNDR